MRSRGILGPGCLVLALTASSRLALAASPAELAWKTLAQQSSQISTPGGRTIAAWESWISKTILFDLKHASGPKLRHSLLP